MAFCYIFLKLPPFPGTTGTVFTIDRILQNKDIKNVVG